ncbi:hypothetical protein P3T37_004909 [Kitasatospora sp. MAA4]|uniref:MAB_1171c family putative transporter n=1 Tax=Kitasatospora sp. MAA4 TaxID=3035093 RepID=UPI0024766AF7|nr:MAB_1171c family putative transporter [Kitasatospora sp. MAA4]MDH6135493.1 hypothetical protein [Kitasatospora sp. MAA4]
MTALLHPPCAIVAWLALLYKLNALRRTPREVSLLALCAVLGFSALSFTLSIPSVWLVIGQLTGVPELAALLAQSCVMILIGFQQVLLAFWLAPPEQARPRALRRLAFTAVLLAVLVTLFLNMAPNGQHPDDFTLRYATDPYYVVYLSLYIAAYTFGEVEIGRLCWRYSGLVSGPWLRRGLRTTAIGAWITLGYSFIRIADIVVAHAGVELTWAEDLAWSCGDIGALLTLIGWTLPGWGPQLSMGRRLFRSYLCYQRLYPLWRALQRAHPSIALERSPSLLGNLTTVRSLELRLYRRVIEIRDGQLALRDRLSPEVAQAATRLAQSAGLSGEALRATVAAAELKAALSVPEDAAQAAADPAEESAGSAETGDLAEEIAWLVQVSAAFRRSPVVSAALAGSEQSRVTTS